MKTWYSSSHCTILTELAALAHIGIVSFIVHQGILKRKRETEKKKKPASKAKKGKGKKVGGVCVLLPYSSSGFYHWLYFYRC